MLAEAEAEAQQRLPVLPVAGDITRAAQAAMEVTTGVTVMTGHTEELAAEAQAPYSQARRCLPRLQAAPVAEAPTGQELAIPPWAETVARGGDRMSRRQQIQPGEESAAEHPPLAETVR